MAGKMAASWAVRLVVAKAASMAVTLADRKAEPMVA